MLSKIAFFLYSFVILAFISAINVSSGVYINLAILPFAILFVFPQIGLVLVYLIGFSVDLLLSRVWGISLLLTLFGSVIFKLVSSFWDSNQFWGKSLSLALSILFISIIELVFNTVFLGIPFGVFGDYLGMVFINFFSIAVFIVLILPLRFFVKADD